MASKKKNNKPMTPKQQAKKDRILKESMDTIKKAYKPKKMK